VTSSSSSLTSVVAKYFVHDKKFRLSEDRSVEYDSKRKALARNAHIGTGLKAFLAELAYPKVATACRRQRYETLGHLI